MMIFEDKSNDEDTLTNLLKVGDPGGGGWVSAVSSSRRSVRETTLATATLVLGKETKFISSLQKRLQNLEKEDVSCLLYLKSDCKALTAQPCALGQALVGNSDVDRRRDLLPLAPRVGVVNHLGQEPVKQESLVL